MPLMTTVLHLVVGVMMCSRTDQGLQVPKCSWEGAGDPRKFDGECMAGGVYSFDNISYVRSRVHLPTCTYAESLLMPVLTPCALVGHSCVVAVFTKTATWVGGCVDDSSGHAVAYPLATPSVVGNSMLYNYSQLEKARAPTVGLIELRRPCADFYDNDQRLPICYETEVKAFDDRWQSAFVCCCNRSLCTERVVQLPSRTFNFDRFRPHDTRRSRGVLSPQQPPTSTPSTSTPPPTCCYATSPSPPWKQPEMQSGVRLYAFITVVVVVFGMGATVTISQRCVRIHRKKQEKQWEQKGKEKAADFIFDQSPDISKTQSTSEIE